MMTEMGATKMHADEVETDAALVRRLLAVQFPQWADLPVEPVASYGTDHDIYRLGDRLAARLPRIGWATGQAAKEAEWLPRLAPHLPLAIPVQLAQGRPAEGYPFDWSVYEWLPGQDAGGAIDDLEQVAVDLAAFNLLVVDGRLSAVIDFGGLNVGDPACDLQPAWNVFAGDSRERFRAELAADASSWLRGRGWALAQAVVALPYYWDTNPGMIDQASRALANVLEDSWR